MLPLLHLFGVEIVVFGFVIVVFCWWNAVFWCGICPKLCFIEAWANAVDESAFDVATFLAKA